MAGSPAFLLAAGSLQPSSSDDTLLLLIHANSIGDGYTQLRLRRGSEIMRGRDYSAACLAARLRGGQVECEPTWVSITNQ